MTTRRLALATVLASIAAFAPVPAAGSDGTGLVRGSAQHDTSQVDYVAQRRRLARRERVRRSQHARAQAREDLRALAWEIDSLVREHSYHLIYEPAVEAAREYSRRFDHNASARQWQNAAEAAERTHEFVQAAEARAQQASELAFARGATQPTAWAAAASTRADALVRFRIYAVAWRSARSAAERWAALGDHTRAERYWALARLCSAQAGSPGLAARADSEAVSEGGLYQR